MLEITSLFHLGGDKDILLCMQFEGILDSTARYLKASVRGYPVNREITFGVAAIAVGLMFQTQPQAMGIVPANNISQVTAPT